MMVMMVMVMMMMMMVLVVVIVSGLNIREYFYSVFFFWHFSS